MTQVNVSTFELAHWSETPNENKLFSKITWLFLILTIIFAIVVKMVTVPELTREEKAKIPPQLTKFIERVKIEEKPKPTPVEEKKEEVVEEPKVEPKPIKVPKPAPKPDITQTEKVERAREKAQQSGLLAMQDDLAQLREIAQMTAPTTNEPLSTEGQEAAVADGEPKSEAFAGTTASLDNNNVSQTIGKRVELTGREVTSVEAADKQVGEQQVSDTEQAQAVSGGRDVESIREVLDRNKGAFYTIYRRALRKDPSLEGKVEMLIVVEPNGRVSDCSIISSELNDSGLEKKLIARVKLINFGAANVEETSINYSFNFLPF
ncbi:AgmX/PglI C-terminal domain-containing protein [Psychrobium sp. nBUS_13]|uniref:AgmX/PglI C-terminal domain-containing protein n=1 Tax=Psychrobium sp. nBUS_13 TaxID=3395319 RepID=UPI003EB81682